MERPDKKAELEEDMTVINYFQNICLMLIIKVELPIHILITKVILPLN